MSTKIEWCNAFNGRKGETWNPVVGCSHVSEGCENCYAERQAPRVYHAADEPFKPRKQPDQLGKPLHWAAVRFVSCEPLLGAVTLRALKKEGTSRMDALEGMWYDTAKDVPALDWVLCGGESGPGARPMHPRWARGLRDQCVAADVPFLLKHWGAWKPAYETDWHLGAAPDDRVRQWIPGREKWREGRVRGQEGVIMCRVGKKEAGRELDGETWDQVPQV